MTMCRDIKASEALMIKLKAGTLTFLQDLGKFLVEISILLKLHCSDHLQRCVLRFFLQASP